MFRRLLIPIIISSLGVLISLYASHQIQASQKNSIIEKLGSRSEGWISLMESSTEKEVVLAQGVVSLLEEVAYLDELAFQQIVDNALRMYDGFDAIMLVPELAASERPRFEQAKQLTVPGYFFKQFAGPAGFVPAAPAERYYPVYMYEGSKSSAAYLGFELGSFTALSSMFEQLEAPGQNMAMRFMPALQSLLKPGGRPQVQMVLAAPLKTSLAMPDESLHRSNFYIIFLINFSLAVEYFGEIEDVDKLQFSLTTGEGPDKRTIISTEPSEGSLQAEHTVTRTFSNSAASWQVVLTPTDRYFDAQSNNIHRWILLIGILLSLILGWYVSRLKNRQMHIQVLVDQQTEELRAANEELDRLSNTDPLTNVANRRFFDGHLHKEWQRALRNHSVLSLLMIDIDYFKQFNDFYGHVSGDHCLEKVANALKSVVHRPSDMVARFGGEEFAILLPETPEGVEQVAARCCEVVRELAIPHEKSETSKYLTISVGVASISPKADDEPAAFIRLADEALYQAKEQGRNDYVMASTHTDGV